MPLILSLETSTTVCSVAIHQNEKVIVSKEIHEENAHGEKLAVLIDEVLRKSSLEVSQLNAIAVSSGPGSYTGLRIGTSTAKGLCYALNLPLISIDSLLIMASSVRQSKAHLLCPMLDARRMEVYCAMYSPNLDMVTPIEAKIIDASSFNDVLDKQAVCFFGNGAEKCKTVLTHSNAIFLDNIYPSAASLGLLAFEKFEKNEFVDLIHYEPFYLKEFIIKRSAKFEGFLNK